MGELTFKGFLHYHGTTTVPGLKLCILQNMGQKAIVSTINQNWGPTNPQNCSLTPIVEIGIDAPKSVDIYREEIYEKVLSGKAGK